VAGGGRTGRVTNATFSPFEITLTGIEVFPLTNVVYLQLGKGADEMYALHAAMNTEALAFKEPFVYHPHITLAQRSAPKRYSPSANAPAQYGQSGMDRVDS
jgi:2'-5' RNA ligase